MTTINMAWPTGALAGGLCTVTTDKARGDDFPANIDTVMCEYDGRITDIPFRRLYHRVTRVRCRTLGAKALDSLDSESLDIKADVIEDDVFGSHGVNDLQAVTLSGLNGDLASVGGSNFLYGCTGLTSLTLPASLASVGGSNFLAGCTGLTSLTLPASLASVGGSNFLAGCTGLTSLTLPASLASVGGSNFLAGCTGLTSLTLPASLASVGGSNFLYGCTGLTSLTLPASLASVGGSGFLYGCTGLTSLDVQDGFGSKNLNTTWLLDDVKTISTLTLRLTSGMWMASTWTSHLATGATVNVPATLLDAYKADTTWAKFNLQAIGA
ncbi:leucine rich repeat (LRR) protein [Pseudoscardovia suis]|uniref:leucine-rich repeat domain-containing protein n=1 Tax=Pseudoscardovia suis TaxID=987063 RepID=UPI000C239860|nr:leucine-rich repeat domain-containing protein [Pseudoscardovia suis]PJJ64931.1 leucine rich repeat (LRR) protein [Pseudoscardovia suis]